jgi:hypothetical protein
LFHITINIIKLYLILEIGTVWKIDTTRRGIEAVFRSYQWEIITEIQKDEKAWTTKEMYIHVNDKGNKISRASVINFLELLALNGIVTRTEKSGKGGMKGVFSKHLDYPQLVSRITNDLILTLIEAFPDSDYLKFIKGD